jgi:hypothetical protein
MSAGADLSPEKETNYKKRNHGIVAKISITKIHHMLLPHSTETAHVHRSKEISQPLSTPTTETTKRPTL